MRRKPVGVTLPLPAKVTSQTLKGEAMLMQSRMSSTLTFFRLMDMSRSPASTNWLPPIPPSSSQAGAAREKSARLRIEMGFEPTAYREPA
ncbi:MAG: hypothetical protein ACRD2O_08805 [Terriglobia bacterium]